MNLKQSVGTTFQNKQGHIFHLEQQRSAVSTLVFLLQPGPLCTEIFSWEPFSSYSVCLATRQGKSCSLTEEGLRILSLTSELPALIVMTLGIHQEWAKENKQEENVGTVTWPQRPACSYCSGNHITIYVTDVGSNYGHFKWIVRLPSTTPSHLHG